MKRALLIGVCIFAFATMWGQNSPMHKVPQTTPHYDRPENFGFKGGFTSSWFLVSDLNVNGVSIKEVQNNYKIGYFGSVFMRINFERHFLQPEVSYNVNRCNITFRKPLEDDAPIGTIPAEASITSSIHSIDVPVIYGYNFIKEGPYSLAVFGGPKIRYIINKQSDIDFENRECVVFGKGDKERKVYFDARAKIHLQNYLHGRTDEDPALFVTLLKPYNRLNISGVEIRLRELGRRLNIPKVHPHKFRRTLATMAIDKGMPIEQVQQLLGHQSVDTTLQYAMVNQANVKISHRKFIS